MKKKEINTEGLSVKEALAAVHEDLPGLSVLDRDAYFKLYGIAKGLALAAQLLRCNPKANRDTLIDLMYSTCAMYMKVLAAVCK